MTPASRLLPSCLRGKKGGFTLLELVITITLLAILGIVGGTMLYDPFSTAEIVNATNTDAAKGRYALERVTRELREVKRAGASYCFTTMAPTHVAFAQPALNSTDTLDCTAAVNTVSIILNGTDLQLTKSGTTAILTNNVTGFSLAYLTISGTGTTSATDVASVVIELTITDPESGRPNTQRTRSYLRDT